LAFARRDGTQNPPIDQSIIIAGNSASDDGFVAALQIREQGYVGNTQTASSYAPGLIWHWSDVIAGAIKMYADGSFRLRAIGSGGYRNLYAQTLYSNDSVVWSAGNDGSGSGLDADLLDGQHASAFAKNSDFTGVKAYPGWQKTPDGFIDQWCEGTDSDNNELTEDIYFPTPFPNACLDVQVTTRIAAGNNLTDITYQVVGDPTKDYVKVQRQRPTGGADATCRPRIRAKGW
jgi:hypothetical protein